MLAFLFFMLLAVQVLFGLYTTSTITAATYDAARLAAGAGGSRSEEVAEARVRELLGAYATPENVKVAAGEDRDERSGRADFVVTVTARRIGFLPEAFRRPLGLDQISRTARVRIEEPVP